MIQSYISAAGISVLLLISTLGCNYRTSKSTSGPANRAESFQNYSDLSELIFRPKCMSCHGGASGSGGVDLSSYAAMMSQSKLIVPGQPAQSGIYNEVASGDMPDGGPALSRAEVQAISNWIMAGAPNGDFSSGGAESAGPETTPPQSVSPSPPSDGVTSVKYSEIQARIFDQACVHCHSGPKPKGKVDLSNYSALFSGPKHNVVVPNSADTSLVYTEIVGGSMPPNGPTISAAELALLFNWINQGARND